MKYLVLVARALFSQMFIIASLNHFRPETIQNLSSKVPAAELLIPLSGAMALIGGISILLGYKAKIGGLLIALFLIPVTLMMHDFWNMTDPMMRMFNQVNFQKNLAMLGGAILIVYFGAGPLSLDARRRFPPSKMMRQEPEKTLTDIYQESKMHEEAHI
jgi:putative oxidoreductase